MNLRTRITLITCLGFSLLAIGLVVEGLIREHNVALRLQQSRQDSFRYAWDGVVNTEIQRLTLEIPAINRNRQALDAVTQGDPQAFIEAIRPLLLRFQTGLTSTQLEVVGLDASLFHADLFEEGQRLLDSELIAAVVERGGPVSGLFFNRRGDYVVATAFPLFSRVQPTGVAAFQVPANQLLGRLANSTGAEFFLVNPQGVSTGATDDELWQAIQARRDNTGAFPERIFLSPLPSASQPHPGFLDTRVLSLVELPLVMARGPGGELLAVEEMTTSFWRNRLASVAGYGIAALSVILFLAVLYWYLRRAFAPLNAVIQVLNNLAAGDTRATISLPPGDDEIGSLASTVEGFRQALEARGQLQIIRQELEVATRIQSAIRPADSPRREDFSLHAEIHTAREVGGDFFDYFELPDGRFAMVVADVSGKGIGAALFMAVARTVMRTTAMILPAPQDCLARTNDFLSLDNQESMFVTAFYAILDPTNATLTFANAGHNPPIHLRSNGTLEPLPTTGGIALGVMSEFEFPQEVITLAPGDRLLLYTDGVTEAINPQAEEFGVDRLQTLLSEIPETGPKTLVKQVLDAVIRFANGAPQADDITLMAMTFQPYHQNPKPVPPVMDTASPPP